MPTLITPTSVDKNTTRLSQAARELGWKVLHLKGEQPSRWLREQGPVLYGQPQLLRLYAQALDLALISPAFDSLIKIPRKYLGRNFRLVPLKEARQAQYAYYRPQSGFPAGIYQNGSFIPRHLPEDLPVLLAEPTEWLCAYRAFIIDGDELVSLAPILPEGENDPGDDEELESAIEFIATLVGDQRLDLAPAFVLDIGLIDGLGWAVKDLLPAWNAELYGCEPQGVLRVLQRACLKTEDLTPADQAWIT